MQRYIGVMSGTSMDGVDVALCEIDARRCELVASYEHPFDEALKERIERATKEPIVPAEAGRLHKDLGEMFAEAVRAFMAKEGIRADSVRAVGLHGQTLHHAPDEGFTMQLGDANIVAARCGIDTVSDFRGADMAVGGQGAPLAPAFHAFLYADAMPLALVNIGGIANISVLTQERIYGYDTGPGNALTDAWIAKHKGLHYDADGAWARQGSLDGALLRMMLKDAYFAKNPPKSTGKEYFNIAFIEDNMKKYEALFGNAPDACDVQRTLTELTARTIADAVMQSGIKRVLLCGGGAKNAFLVERIRTLLPECDVGIEKRADMLEAMMVAWLAFMRIHDRPVALKEITGARSDRILGAVWRGGGATD
jgi:anhydro-N-acetylmuramic acid kinase